MDPAIITALATVSVPMLTILGYGLGQARWQGRVENRLDNLEKDVDEAKASRSGIHDELKELRADLDLRLTGLESRLSEMIGQLRGKGHVQ